MRTKTLLLTAAVCAAGIATSKAQVYSVNAVGYVNTPLVKGYNMISNPLNNTAANGNQIKSLFASLPLGSVIFLFDPATAKYVNAQVDEFTGEVTGPAATTELLPGNGVFVSSPSVGTITFVGEVPQGTLHNAIPKGFSIKASQVPQAGTMATALGYTPTDGEVIFNYNESTQKYDSFSFEFGAWTPSEPTLQVGEAVFINAPAAKSWDRTFSVNQ